MTNKTTEALKLAGKALGRSQQHLDLYHPEWVITRQQNDKALAAIREALAETVKLEPVCSVCCKTHDKNNPVGLFYPPANALDSWEQAASYDNPNAVPLYAAPVERQWVDLTDHEIAKALCLDINQITASHLNISRAISTAFKEKNR